MRYLYSDNMYNAERAQKSFRYQPRKGQSILTVSFGAKTEGFKSLEQEEGTEGVQTRTNVAKKLRSFIFACSHWKTLCIPPS